MLHSDTIVALASGQGRAAIAVIRLSGPGARGAVEAVAGSLPAPRTAVLRALSDPRTGERIDRGLVLWFPGPHSFTGEDSAEFQLHGGRSVVAGMLAALCEACGCRLAQPGEFTRRAFENGKLDLTAVEGLADLIDAETAAQRRQALRQLDGAFGRLVEAWRSRLVQASAFAEAMLDFSDEGDVDSGAMARAMQALADVAREIEAVLAQPPGERLRDGFTVVIAGPPNAGKSSLMNALVQRDAAIVSPIAGTTRDLIVVHLDLGGMPVTLIDTAGIRDSSDPVEQEGIERAKRGIASADLTLWLHPHDVESACESKAPNDVTVVRTKSDLASDSPPKYGEECLNVSALTGAGLGELRAMLAQKAGQLADCETSLVSRRRHRDALETVIACLRRADGLYRERLADELVAEEIRLALRGLGRVVGRVDVEEVLGALFSGFCIGK